MLCCKSRYDCNLSGYYHMENGVEVPLKDGEEKGKCRFGPGGASLEVET